MDMSKRLEGLLAALADRARRGLVEGSWTPEVVAEVARAGSGDGRLAVQALRRAANFADVQVFGAWIRTRSGSRLLNSAPFGKPGFSVA